MFSPILCMPTHRLKQHTCMHAHAHSQTQAVSSGCVSSKLHMTNWNDSIRQLTQFNAVHWQYSQKFFINTMPKGWLTHPPTPPFNTSVHQPTHFHKISCEHRKSEDPTNPFSQALFSHRLYNSATSAMVVYLMLSPVISNRALWFVVLSPVRMQCFLNYLDRCDSHCWACMATGLVEKILK